MQRSGCSLSGWRFSTTTPTLTIFNTETFSEVFASPKTTRKGTTVARNPVAKLATAALFLGLLTLVAPSVAWAAPIATGSVSCPVISGSGTLTPGLTAAGTSTKVKITFHATLGSTPAAGCSGSAVLSSGAPVTVTGGALKGAGSFKAPVGALANSCKFFDGPDIVVKITAQVAWSATSSIAPSKVVYSGGTPAVSGAPTDTISLPAPGTSTVKSGSLASPVAPNNVTLATNIPSSCGSSTISTFTITGGTVSL